MKPAETLFSRDFDALKVGETFESRRRTITESDIVGFSQLTGDWHPQHSDAVWAAQSPFHERIAHGMLILSYAIGLVQLEPARIVALRRLGSATFKAPVRIGDTIAVDGRISNLKSIDGELGLVETSWKIVNQDRRTVARMTIEVLWRRGRVVPGAPMPSDEVDLVEAAGI